MGNPELKEETMKIGEYVKQYVETIISYCINENPEELSRLKERDYSKKTFDVNYPFCKETDDLEGPERVRYWRNVYNIGDHNFLVTSQWFEGSRDYFTRYLLDKDLITEEDAAKFDSNTSVSKERSPRRVRNSRYRGNAIGNAQNLFVRNILSNLGDESFGEEDWKETKSYFDKKCAYCGTDGELEMEHAIPINKIQLGEHRLGNIVPSCRKCNKNKRDLHYKDFLDADSDKIHKIEQYMESRHYTPITDNRQMERILDLAYKEIGDVAERYIQILNEIIPSSNPQ